MEIPTCGDECKQLSEISAAKRYVAQVGSCNGCTAHAFMTVKEVHLRGLSFRLCGDCEAELINKLRAA